MPIRRRLHAAILALTLTLTLALVSSTPAIADRETDTTRELEEELTQVAHVASVRARYFDDADSTFLSITVELGSDVHAGLTPPITHAVRRAVEASEYSRETLLATLEWTDGGLHRSFGIHGPVRLLGALANEAPTMQDLEALGLDETTLELRDNAMDAQYLRDINVTLPAHVPARAFNRLADILRTRVPDTRQETQFVLGSYDWDATPSESRRLRVRADAAPELVEALDRAFGSPALAEYDGGSTVTMSVSGHGPTADEQYVSVTVDLHPDGLNGRDEDELEDHAGDDEVMAVTHGLAEDAATPEGAFFFTVRLSNDTASVTVADLYSYDCASVWADESGRSREVWATWVEAGGTPGEDGATATDCPAA